MKIAHIRHADGHQQTLEEHFTETAALAALFAAKLDLSETGELLGLMHDFGKYSADFQKYIRAATGIDPDADDEQLPNGKKIDQVRVKPRPSGRGRIAQTP